MLRRGLFFLVVSFLTVGPLSCNEPQPKGGAADAKMFGPVSMRIHPTFTRIKDWNGDKAPDGIDALLELQDQFGEPTRATGRVIFELFEYRRNFPNPAGKRLFNPWVTSLVTVEDQSARWNRALRAYSFQLVVPQIQPHRTYVLTASFELEGGRLFDRLILEPKGETESGPAGE
jgi:hypothetical protein